MTGFLYKRKYDAASSRDNGHGRSLTYRAVDQGILSHHRLDKSVTLMSPLVLDSDDRETMRFRNA